MITDIIEIKTGKQNPKDLKNCELIISPKLVIVYIQIYNFQIYFKNNANKIKFHITFVDMKSCSTIGRAI